jgi:octaprenyl-diphosphate synthase
MSSLLPSNSIQAPRMGAITAFVRDDLHAVERVFAQTLASESPHVQHLIEHLSHYRGKRLRPVLHLLVAQACGRVTREHHVIAAVIEMIHTATLVHDDVLDNATTRRHVPTINANWGNRASILLGDLLFTHAFHLVSTLGNAATCEAIGAATNRVCAGELQQISLRGNLQLSEREYFEIIDGKTAELTACACELGARHAGASPEIVEAMETYGRALGQAFQIADDLLDLVGEESAAGKTLGTDLDEQKATLPLIRLFERSSPAERQRLQQLIREQGRNCRAEICQALEQTGALHYARAKASALIDTARAALQVLPDSPARECLEQLTDWTVLRDR